MLKDCKTNHNYKQQSNNSAEFILTLRKMKLHSDSVGQTKYI